MSRRRLFAPLVLAALLLAGACGDDGAGPSPEEFTATLSGQNERPTPVTTSASGTATFTLEGTTVDYILSVSNLTGVTAAHIHGPASAEANAGVLVTLHSTPNSGTTNGTLAQGSFAAGSPLLKSGVTVDSVLTLMRAGNAYVNVHTSANPAGELRGQIRRR